MMKADSARYRHLRKNSPNEYKALLVTTWHIVTTDIGTTGGIIQLAWASHSTTRPFILPNV